MQTTTVPSAREWRGRIAQARGFAVSLAAYAFISALRVDQFTDLVVWAAAALGAAWWYTVCGGPWIDRSKGFVRASLEGVGLIVAGIALVLLASLLLPNPTAHKESALPSMSAEQIAYLLVAIPVLEEVMFRGLLFDVVAPTSVWLAVLLTAIADSIAHGIGHGSALYAAAILPGSLILGAVRQFTKGLSVPIAIHVLIDVLGS